MRRTVGVFLTFLCFSVYAWGQEASPAAPADATPAVESTAAPAAIPSATPVTDPAVPAVTEPAPAPAAEPAAATPAQAAPATAPESTAPAEAQPAVTAPQEVTPSEPNVTEPAPAPSTADEAAPAEEAAPAPAPVVPDEPELPLQEVFDRLGLLLTPEDEINVVGPTQGQFIQAEKEVQVVPVAKFSFGRQEKTSQVNVGFYSLVKDDPFRQYNTLFELGPEAGGEMALSGIPNMPRSPIYLKKGLVPIGFFVQSANFNPDFSVRGETIYTEDYRNLKIERLAGNVHKARVFPYRDLLGERPHWFVICWEFSTNDDFQDVITVVRGVDMIVPHTGIEVDGKHYDPNPLVPVMEEPITADTEIPVPEEAAAK